MLGVTDPDAVIAERLSGESPFLSTIDIGPVSEGSPAPAQTPASVGTAVMPPPAEQVPPLPEAMAELPDLPRLPDLPEVPELPTVAEPPVAPAPPAPRKGHETIDLSEALGGIKMTPPPLEDVFDSMRTRALRESQTQNAQAQYAAAIDHANNGRLEQAIAAFEEASRVPMMRWQAGTRLGRLHIARGDLQHGVEWLERAAQAPAPSEEDGHAVMYELGDALERLGESARALAVLLELRADAGEYRDLATRIERLAKVQAQ
jgi:tetratricopeptide (TPR) repeat protein